MHNFQNKNVVITGGSTGIGFSIAREFASRGSRLFLLARDREKLTAARDKLLTEFGTVSVETFAIDVADKPAVLDCLTTIGREKGGIHALIANAGMIRCGRFEDQTDEDLTGTLSVNYLGVTNAIRAAWPFLARETGHIAIVSSVAGYLGIIGQSTYAPTKFALTGLAECLRMEARDRGIHVTIIYPPDTKTPQLDYERLHTLPESLALSKSASVMEPGVVARQLVDGMQKGRFEVFCNLESRIIRIIRVVWPALYFSIVDKIVKKSRNGSEADRREAA